MDAIVPFAFALGLVGGFRHAFEPDHVLAVSTLLHREPALVQTLRTGLAWGAGHTTMLMLGVLCVHLLGVEIGEAQLGYFELPVAFMLLGLGGWALYEAGAHLRAPSPPVRGGIVPARGGARARLPGFPGLRSGWRGYAVGLVHGLAGSGALLLLTAATLPSVAASVGYALLYGAGSMLGMAAVTLGLAVPLLAARARPVFYATLAGLSGVLSILLGGSILIALA